MTIELGIQNLEKMEICTKTVNDFQPLTIFPKSFFGNIKSEYKSNIKYKSL